MDEKENKLTAKEARRLAIRDCTKEDRILSLIFDRITERAKEGHLFCIYDVNPLYFNSTYIINELSKLGYDVKQESYTSYKSSGIVSIDTPIREYGTEIPYLKITW